MEIQHRHSYGIIPLIGTPENWKLLLIDQKDPKREHHWTFPKGTPEAGESPLETAIRETEEEVGIRSEVVDPDFSCVVAYSFERDGIHIEKQVTYFVGRAASEDFTLQEAEVKEARWVTAEEAKALLTFEDRTGSVIDTIHTSGVIERLLK